MGSEKLDKKDKKRIEKIVGSFLYYARAVDVTTPMALSEIAGQKAAPTINTKKEHTNFWIIWRPPL